MSPLNYYQTMVPSLSHFENLPYEAMGLNEVHTGNKLCLKYSKKYYLILNISGTSANSREIKMTNSSVYKPFPRYEISEIYFEAGLCKLNT